MAHIVYIIIFSFGVLSELYSILFTNRKEKNKQIRRLKTERDLLILLICGYILIDLLITK